MVERKLNDTNYVLQKSAKSKAVVVHVDRMRKLPQSLDSGSTIRAHTLSIQLSHRASGVGQRQLQTPQQTHTA